MFTLLVTGTISPPNQVPFLELKDETARYKQYKESILNLLESRYINKLIFCENSGSEIELDHFKEKAMSYNKQFEYITFEADDRNITSNGKGFGEGEIILYALNNSELLRSEKFFFKLTGRLNITNIDNILKESVEGVNYFNRVEFFRKNNKVDTRFYGVNISDYLSYLASAYESVRDNDGRYLEHVFYERLSNSNLIHRSTVYYPRFTGISGSSGNSYAISYASFFVKNFITRICKLKIN